MHNKSKIPQVDFGHYSKLFLKVAYISRQTDINAIANACRSS